MTMELPRAGQRQTPEDHATISRRLIVHAREQLDLGDRLQAAEKVWGAAAHALKSIAIQRGWRHNHHEYMFPIAGQLAREYDRPEFHDWLGVADSCHGNFYSNQRDEDSIGRAIEVVEQFVADLEVVRSSPPRPVTVESNAERNRLQVLLGRAVPIGSHSEVGFTRTPRRRRPLPQDDQGAANDH